MDTDKSNHFIQSMKDKFAMCDVTKNGKCVVAELNKHEDFGQYQIKVANQTFPHYKVEITKMKYYDNMPDCYNPARIYVHFSPK